MADETYPNSFFCPLTHEIFKDPVLDPDGNTYERSAIVTWLQQHDTSPITRSPLTVAQLIPNRALKEAIEAKLKEAGGAAPSSRIVTAAPTTSTNTASNQPTNPLKENIIVTCEAINNNKHPDEVIMLTSIHPPEGMNRTPHHICCVVDISGSMGTEASMKNANGEVETHGLSVLDVVKHAVKTVVHLMTSDDYVSLVVYGTTSKIIFERFQMNEGGKKSAEEYITKLQLEGQTNLWAGLENAMDVVNKYQQPSVLSAILLLTDGMPNIEPPRGHIPMLERYIQNHPEMACSIHTFGFGYEMDSPLLRNIAQIGNGVYSFIPDSGFVGTAFVNTVSNLLVTAATNLELNVEALNGYSIKKISGGHIHKKNDTTTTISLGSIQYGQTRDVVVVLSAPKSSSKLAANENYAAVSVSYKHWTHNEVEQKKSELTVISEDSLLVTKHWIRSQLIDYVSQVLAQNPNQITDKNCQYFLKELSSNIAKKCNDDPASLGLKADIDGQITESFLSEYYYKWGRHYLPSLMRCHQLQQCLNFKDPGIQFYGGKLFSEIRDFADEVFCKLPPPTGSLARYSSASKSYSALSSMQTYYSSSNTCFSGDSLVLMGNGQLKPCKNIQKGDIIMSVNNQTTQVRCVVKSFCKQGKANLVELKGGLVITPYHPVRIDGKWKFPLDIAEPKEFVCDAVYSFVLKAHNVMLINGVQCVTLGHSFAEPVVKHPYFGSQLVIADLKKMKGWNAGLVQLAPNTMIKNSKTALVCGLNVHSEISV